MKRASFIILCLMVSLTQAQTAVSERTVHLKSGAADKINEVMTDNGRRTFLNADTIPFTGVVFDYTNYYTEKNTKAERISNQWVFVNGVKHGMQISFYDSGEPQWGMEYADGKKVRLVRWDKKGNVLEEKAMN